MGWTHGRTLVLAFAAIVATDAAAWSAEIVRPDGTRETVTDVRRDSRGAWMATLSGRRVQLRPGDVVAVVDDAGKETSLLPALADGVATEAAQASIARLRDPKNETWRAEADALAALPTRGVHDALVALTTDRSADVRTRGVAALTRLRTAESVAAAAAAVVAEKDRRARLDGASALASVSAIFERADTAASLTAGLADADASIRVVFATIAPRDDERASKVLRTDGLGHSDHHFRETSAVSLAERGDAAGERILVQMLARKRIPGFDAGDEDAAVRATVREHVLVCGLLGRLRTTAGRAALVTAGKSPHAEVRDAAAKALEGW